MRPGKKPAPTVQKKRRGNPGKRRLNATEPVIPLSKGTAFDTPPPQLRRDRYAAAEWRRLAPILRTSRVITDADRGALLSLCEQWSRYRRAENQLRKEELVITSRSGYPMPNPHLSISSKALAMCLKLWVELGCTPSSRSRISTEPSVGPDDPIEAALEEDDSPASSHYAH